MSANVSIDLVRRDIFLGLKEVSNEPTGFIQSVNTNTGAEAAAIGPPKLIMIFASVSASLIPLLAAL